MMLKYEFVLMEMGDRYIAFTVGDSMKAHRGLLNMDSTGAMIFRYLKNDVEETDLIARVAAAFPEEKPGDVADTVRSFIEKLIRAGLVNAPA